MMNVVLRENKDSYLHHRMTFQS